MPSLNMVVMKRISLLPDHVANQIAAGEVVERPASVVKELVENAIDAGATRITVELDAGGRSLIRITDDGHGMNRDDALMSLERHATSKLKEASDLTSIRSMGFRGEALPSIASVSRFTLTTREQGSESSEATRIMVVGGKLTQVEAAAGPSGTSIEVRQLFYNLPARRKFLKTKETEKAHIQTYLRLAALAHPSIGFKLVQDQRVLWQLNPLSCDETLDSRMLALEERMRQLEKDSWQRLPVQFRDTIRTRIRGEDEDRYEEEPILIWGYVGAPGVGRSNRNDQCLFINGRPVENKALNFALREAYHTALMKGMHPVCCLFLEISPAFVDVNVHPAKKEVRFHNEQAVKQCVMRAIKRSLTHFAMAHRSNDPEFQPASEDTTPSSNPADPMHQSALREGPLRGSGNQIMDLPSFDPTPTLAQKNSISTANPPSMEWKAGTVHPAADSTPKSGMQAAQTASIDFSNTPQDHDRMRPILARQLRLIGVVSRLYVLYESESGLVLIDQHAAHERVLFEQMLSRMEQGDVASQGLLVPETIELQPADAAFLTDSMACFQKLGVGIRAFGDQTFILESIPPFIKTGQARSFLLGVLDTLNRSGEVNKMRLGEEMIAKTVCRHAVKANDSLGKEELEKLLEDLKGCTMPYTCPHGRPTVIEMSLKELDRRFGRIVP